MRRVGILAGVAAVMLSSARAEEELPHTTTSIFKIVGVGFGSEKAANASADFAFPLFLDFPLPAPFGGGVVTSQLISEKTEMKKFNFPVEVMEGEWTSSRVVSPAKDGTFSFTITATYKFTHYRERNPLGYGRVYTLSEPGMLLIPPANPPADAPDDPKEIEKIDPPPPAPSKTPSESPPEPSFG